MKQSLINTLAIILLWYSCWPLVFKGQFGSFGNPQLSLHLKLQSGLNKEPDLLGFSITVVSIIPALYQPLPLGLTGSCSDCYYGQKFMLIAVHFKPGLCLPTSLLPAKQKLTYEERSPFLLFPTFQSSCTRVTSIWEDFSWTHLILICNCGISVLFFNMSMKILSCTSAKHKHFISIPGHCCISLFFFIIISLISGWY